MKMLRQRFRERSESWLGSGGPPPPPHPPPPDLHNNINPVSILTNTIAIQQHAMQSAPPSPHPNQHQQLNVPNSVESNRQDQQQHQQQHQQQERPRKKLSFRDPEVTSTAGKNQQASSTQQPNVTTRQNPAELTDSMENIDLEVFSNPFVLLLFER